MTRILSVVTVAFLAGSLFAVADPPPKADVKIAALIDDLGSEVYLERETAEKNLEALGEPAVAPLLIAVKSPNAEISRRARDILTRIERKLGNEKVLAPTMVELDFKQTALSEVLNELASQSKYPISFTKLGTAPTLTEKTEVTIKTGKVPFWEAVTKLCDAADLEIAAVSGFATSEYMHQFGNPNTPADPRIPNTSPPPLPRPVNVPSGIVLVPRGKNARRPFAIYGAVLVEAFTIPNEASASDSVCALLQVWPEPKLNWQVTRTVSVSRASDDLGQFLTSKVNESLMPPQVFNGKNVRIVRNVNGGVILGNPNADVPLPGLPNFTPNVRQGVLNLKLGEKPSASLKEVIGAVHATVRSEPEPLITFTAMEAGKAYEGAHPAGANLKATMTKAASGAWQVEVELVHSPTIQPGINGAIRTGNVGFNSVLGLQVSDANGNLYSMTPTAIRHLPIANNNINRFYTFSLTAAKGEAGNPVNINFSGTFSKPVEVPFVLKNVPLSGGKK